MATSLSKFIDKVLQELASLVNSSRLIMSIRFWKNKYRGNFKHLLSDAIGASKVGLKPNSLLFTLASKVNGAYYAYRNPGNLTLLQVS